MQFVSLLVVRINLDGYKLNIWQPPLLAGDEKLKEVHMLNIVSYTASFYISVRQKN